MKSATTYLQGLAEENQTRLAQQQVLWPAGDAPFLALADLQNRDDKRAGREGAWASFVREVGEFTGDAVLSNELLAPLGPGKLKRLVSGMSPAQVQVVVTARDLGRVIPSHWQTTLKNGGTTSWAEFASAVCATPQHSGNVGRSKDISSWFWRRHDVPAILARWQQCVPIERMTVVTVPPPSHDPHLVADRFASVIGVDPSGFEQPEYVNSSVGASSAELLRRLNLAAGPLERHHYRWGVKEGLAKLALIGRAEQEPPYGLSQDHVDWVCARADRMIEEIRASSVRIVGDLEDLRPSPDVRAGLVEPDATSDADLLEVGLTGLAEMVKVVGDERLARSRGERNGGST
jgi:hypothetical protein